MKAKILLRCENEKYYLNGILLSPERSQKIINHSPDGFSHGYGGSGPSQLSLAILLEICEEETAKKHYQDFKWQYIATLPKEDFEKEIIILI